MNDPYLIPYVLRKPHRVCENLLCGKSLSALNKQGFCFCCYNKRMLGQSPGFRARAVNGMSAPGLLGSKPASEI